MNILFICSGNTCRSPLAQGMCTALYGKEHTAESAGMWVYSCDPPSKHGQTILNEKYGTDLSSHRSHNVTEEEMQWCDRAYVMTYTQYEVLRHRFPEYSDKVELLDKKIDIQDPFGGTLEKYETCAEHIRISLAKELGDPA